MQLKTRVLKLLRRDSYSPSTIEQIYKQLKQPHLQLNHLMKTLNLLEGENKVSKADDKYIAVGKGPDILRGRFEANKKGFGFVINPVGDIYIRSDKVNNALNGDLVEARITRRKKRKNFEGVITRVLVHKFKEIIGRVEVKGNQKWLIPSDRRVQNIFLLDGGAEAIDGQMVVASITKYPPKGLVKLIEVLGDEHSPGIEIEVIIREHNLRRDWPEEVSAQAAELPSAVKEKDVKGRKDYRNDYVVTIDGLDAKDFDDAVSIKKVGGNYHLAVHIADVSAYVSDGSPLDEEAKARGNSTYLSDRVLPMFPFELSNEIASLNPKVDRLTLSVEMIINPKGDVESFSIHKGVIKSKARLTYEEVDKNIKSKKFADEKQKKLISMLLELQKILEDKRRKEGSLVFETIEPKVLVDEELNPQEIIVRQRTLATAIIEEMMVITNKVVAEYMSKRRYPIIYRLHEEPAEDAFMEIEGMLSTFNFPIKELKTADSKTYQLLIKFASTRPEKLLINSVLIRSMQKARYSATGKHHFGLGLNHYCHFTSPIRRYADLVVHRLVKQMLAKKYDFDKQELTGQLQELAENISVTEVESAAAERESVDVMIARYMEDKVGEVYDAIITGITHFGFFIQIPNSAEGLVHITSLKDDYYVFEPQRYLVRGRRSGKVYRLGQELKVQLMSVIIGERQLDFQVVENPKS